MCGGWVVIHSHSICNSELQERERKSGLRSGEAEIKADTVGQRRPRAVCLRSGALWVRCKAKCVSSACIKGTADGDRLRTRTAHEVEARIECATGGKGSVVTSGNARDGSE